MATARKNFLTQAGHPSLTFSTYLENPEGARSLYAVGTKATEMDGPLGPSYSP